MRDPVRKTFTAARLLVRFPKSAASAVLDRDFAAKCRLPELPADLMHSIHSFPVIIPPVAYFRSGTQDLQGLASLLSIAKAIGAKDIFEIGTFTGVTALALAMNLPAATIHTLDLPGGEKAKLRIDRYDHAYLPQRGKHRVYEEFPAEAARIVQHEADSAKFDFAALQRKFDLVYVDGAHSDEYVRSDTAAAYRIVADDGVIVWDDYGRAWPEVANFLDANARTETYCLPGIPRRLAVWFGNRERIVAAIPPEPMLQARRRL